MEMQKKASLSLLVFLYFISKDMNNFTLWLSLISISFYLIVTSHIWKRKPTSRWALLIFTSSFVIFFFFNIEIDIAKALQQFKDVYWLLLAIALLRNLSKNIDISGFFSQIFIKKGTYKDTFLLSVYTVILSWPLSLGVVPILIDALKPIVNKPYNLAALSMRIVCATMLLMPTTVGSAAVFSMVSAIQLKDVVFIGFPLFIISFILCQKKSISFCHLSYKEKKISSQKPIYYFIIFWILFIFGYFFLNFNSIQSVSLSGITLYGVFLFMDRKNINLHFKDIDYLLSSVAPEILLLLSCAFLSQTASHIMGYISIQILYDVDIIRPFYIYTLIIFVLPMFCIIGIHPMILFGFAYPLLSPYVGEGAHAYIIWVMMFFSAQLLSPVSINAILAANSLQTSSIKTSFMMHIKYLLILNPIVITYLTYIDK